ncbi:MAG: S-methyl-5-thioribose-1-phosphate isomerase [Gemmatimonadetes bacterium]|nr:S-methyl-5-thioribose-1-phosphate isomerase [Gemmatimonadota bacterium]
MSESPSIAWTPNGAVRLLDQTLLPGETRYVEIDTIDGMIEAIRALRVRGAPLIGVAAAMGLAAAAQAQLTPGVSPGLTPEWFEHEAERLAACRPTAVNLRWAVERMRIVARSAFAGGPTGVAARLRVEAQRIWDEDAAMCRAIGEAGAQLIPSGATILTHCNTGRLATGGIGTAFGVILTAHQQGKGIDVIACEARPLRQGARLTSWELAEANIPARVIVDSAAAAVMARGDVDLVILGADRIAANGDTANKIGTYQLAVLARAHDIPFYVAAPRSTFDVTIPSGDEIPIEERPAAEVETAKGVSVYNPAFDVTPAELITAIVTDRGVILAPYLASVASL